MTFFRLLDALARERRPGHTGVEYGMAVLFKPRFEHGDLGGPSDAIGSFDDYQPAPQFLQVDAAKALAIKLKSGVFRSRSHYAQSSSHSFLPLGRFGTSRNSRSTSARTSYCCSSIGLVASITVSPNSLTMRSY